MMQEQTNSNIGTTFPEVTAKSLANTDESIPASASGKVALVVVAFLRESQPQLDSWLEPFIEKFGGKEGFTFYEVPMISSGYKFMRAVIDGGMRGGIPEPKHKHVVTMYGDVENTCRPLISTAGTAMHSSWTVRGLFGGRGKGWQMLKQ